METTGENEISIEMIEESVHRGRRAAAILATHRPADGSRGIVGTANYCWQVWRIEGDVLRVSFYRVAGVPRAEVPAALARMAFPDGGKLRRRSGYACSYDIL